MPKTVQLIGVDKLAAALRRAPERIREQLQKVVADTTFSMAQRARANVPVDTGALKAAIGSTARGLSGGVTIASGTIRGRRPEVYWRFVEFGSVHNPAFRPFLRPAADAELATAEDRLRTIAREIERDLSTGRTL